ncbi:MAG: sensor domain-containing diguanylate cyclase [Coriobacteriia bacterium]|nr:sensor domain-containing diguanylate cyclase [Coriobacteriia bacterium]
MAKGEPTARDSGTTAASLGPEPNEFYLQVLQDFPALIWRSSTEGSCDWFNTTWLEFTGRTLEEEIGDRWVEGVHEDDAQHCMDVWTHNFAARSRFVMEYRLRRYDGEYRWIRDFGQPFYAPDGVFLGYIGACYDITDLRQMAEDLSHLAAHDPLTGLPNRRAFEVAVTEAAAAARRGLHSAVMFADLDRFKLCNDRFGHERGDRVLQEIAQAMKAVVRDIDMVARIGGDEFGILLRGQSGAELDIIEERLREAVETCGARHDLDIGLSIGSSTIDGERTVSEVLAEADDRMYDCKRREAL